MPVSHCPEFDNRWTHDWGNFQIRVWSCKHRPIRECILDHRMTIFLNLSASGATSCVETKSLACQKNAGRPHEGPCSWCICVYIFPFVLTSGGHRMPSCCHRIYIVWSSVPPGIIGLTKTTRSFPNVIRRSHDFVIRSQCLRVAFVLEYDGIAMAIRRRQRQPNLMNFRIPMICCSSMDM